MANPYIGGSRRLAVQKMQKSGKYSEEGPKAVEQKKSKLGVTKGKKSSLVKAKKASQKK